MIEFATLVRDHQSEIEEMVLNQYPMASKYSYDLTYEDFDDIILKVFKEILGFHLTALESIDLTRDYQGDLLYVLVLNKRYSDYVFYEVWGYGSCSGCDAVYAASDAHDVYRLVLDFAEQLRLLCVDGTPSEDLAKDTLYSTLFN